MEIGINIIIPLTSVIIIADKVRSPPKHDMILNVFNFELNMKYRQDKSKNDTYKA